MTGMMLTLKTFIPSWKIQNRRRKTKMKITKSGTKTGIVLLLFSVAFWLTASPRLQNRLQLPEKIYAVPGIECNLYFENIFLTLNHANYAFEVKCPKGRCDEKRWRFIPKKSEAGTYDLLLNVYDDNGLVATASSKVVVTPADAGKGKTVSLLLIGSSAIEMRHAFPSHIFKLFQSPGNPVLKMIGENGPGWPDKIGEIRHEGYGGWSFTEFTTAGRRVIKGRSNARGNPFWNPETKALDFAAYFQKNNGGKAPDFITVTLGGNDISSYDDARIDQGLVKIRERAEVFLSALRKAAPEAVIGLTLNGYCSRSQDAFGNNYGCKLHRWQFLKNTFKYRVMIIDLVKKSPGLRLQMVPMFCAHDNENNVYKRKEPANFRNPERIMRESNGLHPVPSGYQQAGDYYYAWMKALLNQTR